MASTNPKMKLAFQEATKGYPPIVTDKWMQSIQKAASGGTGNDAYFQDISNVPEFWKWLSNEGDAGWIPGKTPDGRPVYIAEANNTAMQVLFTPHPQVLDDDFAMTAESTDDQKVIGMATVRTGLVSGNGVQVAAFVISLAEIPPGLVLGKQLIQALIKPVLGRLKNLLSRLAERIKGNRNGNVDDVDSDSSDDVDNTIEEGSEEETEEILEEVAVDLSIDFGGTVLSLTGLAFLAAIPLLLSLFEKTMWHWVQVNNLTEEDIDWQITHQDAGGVQVKPKKTVIPKKQVFTDPFGDKSDAPVAYQADFHFVTKSGLGSIGYVTSFSITDGPEIAIVVFIPAGGDNVIWVGDPGTNPDWNQLYEQHQMDVPKESVSAVVDGYKATFSINKLTGKTEGVYKYTSVLNIEAAT